VTQQPYGTLANRFYVPETFVTAEMLQEYIFSIPFTDREVTDEYGNPIQQMMEVETYKYFASPDPRGVNLYGFQRGNLAKLKRVFQGFQIIDKRAAPPLGFDLKLNPEVEQDDRWTAPAGQKIMIDFWKAMGSGGIKAPPAWGKTVFCIGLTCVMGLKTLILLHDRTLAEQWIQRYRDHTNITQLEQELGEPLIGTYKKGQFFPITVATYQSLHSTPANIQIAEDHRNDFGLTINDEGHHEAAETFSRITTIFNPRHRCWVTATPERKDGLHKAIFDMVGLIVGEGKDERDTGTVKFIYTGKKVDKRKQYVALISDLVRSSKRNKMIVDLAVKLLTEEDRKVLVITERVQHANWLAEQIAIRIEPWEKKARSLVGGQRNFERIFKQVEDDELHCIVATKVMNEGKDCKPLDTLIIATPNNNKAKTEQIVGRIQRRFVYADGRTKKPLLVFDFVDDNPMCWAFKKTREKVYWAIGFDVIQPPPKPTRSVVGMPKMTNALFKPPVSLD
jgi:superfamily II DNA or RNA helicase